MNRRERRSPSPGIVSFEDVSSMFSLPIAEASLKLDVCASTLKKICKENGISRWPYRKRPMSIGAREIMQGLQAEEVMAGKSIDYIKKEAAKEMALAEELKHRLAKEQQATLQLAVTINTSGIPSEGRLLVAGASNLAQLNQTVDYRAGGWKPGFMAPAHVQMACLQNSHAAINLVQLNNSITPSRLSTNMSGAASSAMWMGYVHSNPASVSRVGVDSNPAQPSVLTQVSVPTPSTAPIAYVPNNVAVNSMQLSKCSQRPMSYPFKTASSRMYFSHQKHRPTFTTYFQDFRLGFPCKGLSASSYRWWGGAECSEALQEGVTVEDRYAKDSGEVLTATGNSKNCHLSHANCLTDNDASRNSIESNGGEWTMPCTLLTRTRKKAASNSHRALRVAVAKGYGVQNVTHKDSSVLEFLFGDSLPKHWRAALPSTTYSDGTNEART